MSDAAVPENNRLTERVAILAMQLNNQQGAPEFAIVLGSLLSAADELLRHRVEISGAHPERGQGGGLETSPVPISRQEDGS